MDEFPMTVTGKIRRRDLREREIQRITAEKPSR
jgi:acyl-coenzyme A synthetase/AMP-(fatty) acid ligase